MTAAGIVFSNIHDNNLPELTKNRALAAVPFGCRYRLIDFTLSNMVNSDIYNIHVITQNNYQSLMEHIGSGKDWDLARRSGGLKLLPPYVIAGGGSEVPQYRTRLDALKNVQGVLEQIREEYVVMSDCDVICNVDFRDMIRDHIASGADMTLAVKRMELTAERARTGIILRSDENGRVSDCLIHPTNYTGEGDVSLNLFVLRKNYLRHIVRDAVAHGYGSMTRDVLLRNMDQMQYRVYRYDGYFACITSLTDYYRCNRELLDHEDVKKSLLAVPNRPIYTKVYHSVPTYFASGVRAVHSMIADGCVIEGEVENSILFRGVRIGRNTRVRNSILLPNTQVGENTELSCVLTDKNVMIRDNRVLSGCELQPYYLDKSV